MSRSDLNSYLLTIKFFVNKSETLFYHPFTALETVMKPPSIYIIKATLQRHNALFHSNNEFLKSIVCGTGLVCDPLKLDKSITGNKFRKNDVVLIVKAGKRDQSKIPWLFTEGEYSQILRKTIKEEKAGPNVIPGIENLNHFDYLINVGLKWGGQYLKARAKRTKKLTQHSPV